MFKKFVQLSAIAAATAKGINKEVPEGPVKSAEDHWAVIVVGSRGFGNYRHHADGCHAYQLALTNGIPEDQIILIAYDDVAMDHNNPFPGQLFNKPTDTGTDGVDVYDGCKIDYKGKLANKDTVLGVLQGDPTVGDKVLQSNADSKIFFYYADHGAPGLVAMPTGKFLYANELEKAFQFMFDNQMYKEMVVYMEACESGSMFEKILKKDLNIYAVSAANGKESSWGTYCHPDDKINGKHVGSCLGDLFSVNWMEDTDQATDLDKLGIETLRTQYNVIKGETNKSHVLQWGDLSFIEEPIGEFMAGEYSSKKTDMWTAFKTAGKAWISDGFGATTKMITQKNDFAVDVRDIDLHYLYSKVLTDPSTENQEALLAELQKRLHIDQTFTSMFPQFHEQTKKGEYPLPTTDADFDCYSNLIDLYTEACGKPDTYTMKYFGNFLNQCQAIKYYPAALEDFKGKLAAACPKTPTA